MANEFKFNIISVEYPGYGIYNNNSQNKNNKHKRII